MTATVTIRGEKELQRKLQKLNPNQLEAAMTAGGNIVKNEMQKYPPPPAGSTYVRTGELGRKWKTKAIRKDFAVRIYNQTPYAPYVQGDQRQASIHSGRWQTLVKTTKDNLDEVVKELKKAVDRILRRG